MKNGTKSSVNSWMEKKTPGTGIPSLTISMTAIRADDL